MKPVEVYLISGNQTASVMHLLHLNLGYNVLELHNINRNLLRFSVFMSTSELTNRLGGRYSKTSKRASLCFFY
jgi:hypothetical protein